MLHAVGSLASVAYTFVAVVPHQHDLLVFADFLLLSCEQVTGGQLRPESLICHLMVPEQLMCELPGHEQLSVEK